MSFLLFLALILILFGLGLISSCIFAAYKYRSKNKKGALSDSDLNLKIGKMVAINLAGLFLSMIGIMSFVVAIILD